MKKYNNILLLSILWVIGSAHIVEAKPICGMDSGSPASGKPIIVGGIHGNAAPGDFSASTDAAKAYFDCVNANGGITILMYNKSVAKRTAGGQAE